MFVLWSGDRVAWRRRDGGSAEARGGMYMYKGFAVCSFLFGVVVWRVAAGVFESIMVDVVGLCYWFLSALFPSG